MDGGRREGGREGRMRMSNWVTKWANCGAQVNSRRRGADSCWFKRNPAVINNMQTHVHPTLCYHC